MNREHVSEISKNSNSGLSVLWHLMIPLTLRNKIIWNHWLLKKIFTSILKALFIDLENGDLSQLTKIEMNERGLSVFVNATILTNSTASLGVPWNEAEWSCKFFTVLLNIKQKKKERHSDSQASVSRHFFSTDESLSSQLDLKLGPAFQNSRVVNLKISYGMLLK